MFSLEWEHILVYDDQQIVDLYNYESHGIEVSNKNNGFLIGKRWMDVHVKMWNEDIKTGYLRRSELYEDGKYPKEWLDSVLK